MHVSALLENPRIRRHYRFRRPEIFPINPNLPQVHAIRLVAMWSCYSGIRLHGFYCGYFAWTVWDRLGGLG